MLHSNIVVGDNHYIQNWSVVDNTARDALTVATTDVGKVCQVTGTSKYFILTDDSPMTWTELGGSGGSGDVVGPASATDNAIVRFDFTTGKLIQDSGITIADGATGTLSGTNTGDQNLFSTIAVSGQSDVVADTTSDTLTLAAGSNITITTNAGTDTITIAASGGGGGITLGTPVASTSGTSIDFTGIPAGVNVINVMFAGVSTNGADLWLIQLGDSGGVETTGYLSATSQMSTGTGSSSSTAGFILYNNASTIVVHGTISLTRIDGNTWTAYGVLSHSDVSRTVTAAGSKTLSAELDRVRITTTGGTQTFAAGTINIQYQG